MVQEFPEELLTSYPKRNRNRDNYEDTLVGWRIVRHKHTPKIFYCFGGYVDIDDIFRYTVISVNVDWDRKCTKCEKPLKECVDEYRLISGPVDEIVKSPCNKTTK